MERDCKIRVLQINHCHLEREGLSKRKFVFPSRYSRSPIVESGAVVSPVTSSTALSSGPGLSGIAVHSRSLGKFELRGNAQAPEKSFRSDSSSTHGSAEHEGQPSTLIGDILAESGCQKASIDRPTTLTAGTKAERV